MPPDFEEALAAIAHDHVTGATALVQKGLTLLGRACGDPSALRETARALCRAQPTMAGFYTAGAVALAADDPAAALEALSARLARAPAAIASQAASLLGPRRQGTGPVRIVTCSRSALVEHTLLTLEDEGALQVCCAESRPRLEGLGLAELLAAAGVDVTLYSDAGISSAIPGADALVVGADAVGPPGFINKVGTAALAALARACGIPVLVLAGRERIVPEELYGSLPLVEGPPAEVARARIHGVRNPYFERISNDSLDLLVTDAGVFGGESAMAGSLWSPAVRKYLSLLTLDNMLDKS